MTLIEACTSLKLECALRELGFVEIGWRAIAHAGIYFIEPVGYASDAGPEDDMLGFLLERHVMSHRPNSPRILMKSAKGAFEMAEMVSGWPPEDWDYFLT